jgi:hypothetical protein
MRPELPTRHPELLAELRDALVGVASHHDGHDRVPEGAMGWWTDQAAAAADHVLARVFELVDDAMRRRVERSVA